MAKETARIAVYTPIPKGMRWFEAETAGKAEVVAEYSCSAIDPDDPDIPHPKCVKEIAQLHPGMDLVFYDGGVDFSDALKKNPRRKKRAKRSRGKQVSNVSSLVRKALK